MKKLNLIVVSMLLTLAAFAQNDKVKVGAESTDEYFQTLKGKRIAVMSNHTGMVGDEHLVDLLVRNKFNVVAIMSPEHGFRGEADAGEYVSSSVDQKTGIPIRSLYDGDMSRPADETMNSFDILVFDIQDNGSRYYTYYVSMCKLMDGCAQFGKKMLILDRPNPWGHMVDGPILDMKYKSGVGWLPITALHGMTLGELAKMINGEKWLPGGRQCEIEVIKCKNYTHKTMYQLPIAPSPNLPNMKSIYLFPSTCFFEGTPVSLGRGVPGSQFQVYGHPDIKGSTFSFTPRSVPGAKNPPQLDKLCYGVDLRNIPDSDIYTKGLDLSYLVDAYKKLNIGDKFFTPFFEKLIGVGYVRQMINEGKTAEEIHAMWKDDVQKFAKQRAPYLLYAE